MKIRFNARRKGMTLAGMMIVIAVIAVLATMMMYSSTEAIATAKATQIIANLQILKRATRAWYVDNRDKVQPDGRVKIGDITQPIQQFTDEQLKLASYLSHLSGTGLNVNKSTAKYDSNTGNSNTNLKEGYYRICDGGTVKTAVSFDVNGKATHWKETEYHRNRWYVGYAFKADEGLVREKIKGRLESAGVFFGTADAHEDTYNDNSAAVWMRVL